MSTDPDAEPDVIEDEPRRFGLRWPRRSAVASTALVSLIVLGGGAFVRSISTSELDADQVQRVETPAVGESSGPGAAGVDDSMSEDVMEEDLTVEGSTPDSSVGDDGFTSDTSAPVGPPPDPRRMVRREFLAPDGPPPGVPLRERPPRGPRP